MLSIPDSLGRDIDKFEQGKAPAPELDKFLSDETLQSLKDQHTGPVHAEGLRPISKAEARRRTTFGGSTLPALPATRRVIPAPFRRNLVTGGSHGKSWKLVSGSGIREGDIIAGVGLVTAVAEAVEYSQVGEVTAASGLLYEVTGAGGVAARYRGGDQVKVFR